MPNDYIAILCDLDGTLVQSVGEIITSVNDVLARNDLPQLEGQFITNSVGLGTAWLMERCLSESTAKTITREDKLYKELYPQFIERYAEIAGTQSSLFDGVFETIDKAKEAGLKIGVVTNKGRALAERVLDGHGLLNKIDVLVAGGDTKLAKPHAEPLEYALAQLEVEPEDAVFIGDSSHDIGSARAAGIRVWAMSYGYNHGEDVASSNPDLLFSQFNQVAQQLGLTQSIASAHTPE